ncbi:hypothetical protein NFI96_031415, partial [Prochilodus magdalenae]
KILTKFRLFSGTCRPCLLQRTSAGLRSVHPGGNITLHCDITVEYATDVGTHQKVKKEMKRLITAYREGKLSKSLMFMRVGVNETDLGLYYCGGRNNTQHILFGKAIRLNQGIRPLTGLVTIRMRVLHSL